MNPCRCEEREVILVREPMTCPEATAAAEGHRPQERLAYRDGSICMTCIDEKIKRRKASFGW